MRIKFLDRKSTAEKIIYTIVFILFAAFALSYLYIFFWGIVATLKTHTENVMKPFAFPEVSYFELCGGYGCGKSFSIVFMISVCPPSSITD